MKQDNSMSSLTMAQCKLYLHSGGSMMLNIIIIMVIFASIISAVVYMSSSSLRQAVSSNQGASAWNMAEAGYRYLSINYLKKTDINGSGSADDDKAAYLQSVNNQTYVIPNNGQFTLKVQPYWFYNSTATGAITSVSANLPGTTPNSFTTLPLTGQINIIDAHNIEGIKNYTNGNFNSGTGVFTCTISSYTISPTYKGYNVHLVLNPTSTPTNNATDNTLLIPGENLNLNLVNFPAAAFPAKNGLIEIASTEYPSGETKLYRYSTATASGSTLTLTNIQHSDKSTFSIHVPTAASNITFRKYLMAQSIGKVGNEQRTLSFSQAILDSFPPTADIHKLDTVAELQANFTQSSSITSSAVAYLNTSGGGSAAFSIINSIDTSKSCGAFWYSNTALINGLWAPPPVGTGVYLLTYEVQVKVGTGNSLRAGAVGLAFRSINVNTTSESYLALTFMRYDLPNLYFNRQTGTTAINPGDTVVGATSGATGIVQGTPEITSGSWAGGNATGKIRFASVTGTFSTDEYLKVGGVNRAQVNGNNYFACSLPPCPSTDFIPETIKPKPSDFTSSSPYYSSRYNIGPLLLVLWEKKSDGTLRWLAFKDITYDDYTKGYQDWVQPNGSCTTSCNGNDGLIVNDDASMYIRIQEKRVVLGSGPAVKLNDINVFYGDDSSRYTTGRTANTIPWDIDANRLRYVAGASPFTPVWAPEFISAWDQIVDFFSHIESGTPLGSQPQFQWDAVNPSALADITSGGGVLKICDDGSATCTGAPNGTLRLTELVTPDSGSYSQSEMGMLACGNITTSPYSTAAFAEFAFKTPGTTSGGFVDTTLYW